MPHLSATSTMACHIQVLPLPRRASFRRYPYHNMPHLGAIPAAERLI